MKKYTLLFILLFLFIFNYQSHAQDRNKNWIKETVYRIPTTRPIASPSLDKAYVTIKYYDGLGRLVQEIQREMSGSGKNLLIHHEYDPFGREVKKYLPVPSAQRGLGFVSNAANVTIDYYRRYYGTRIAYSETLFEDSPLERVLKEAAPGDKWKMGSGHEIKYDYDVNGKNEVRMYNVRTVYNRSTGIYETSLLGGNIYYKPGNLYKKVTVDENHSLSSRVKSIEYIDKEGHVVLKRQQTNQGNVDTYYVYDVYGNLAYVIPPLAADKGSITQSVLDGLCYQYRYDKRNRMVAKKLPGVRWQYMVYDKLDRLRATGPAKSPFSDTGQGWLMTKYDQFDRPVMTLFLPGKADARYRQILEDKINGARSLHENSRSSATRINNVAFYYTNISYPTSGYYILTVTYYDDYRFARNSIPSRILNQPTRNGRNGNLLGMTTGQWVRILSSKNKTDSYLTYNIYKNEPAARQIATESWYGNLYHKTHSLINFEGKPLSKHVYHKMVNGQNQIHTVESFSYTRQGRLARHFHEVAGQIRTELARLSYDELGRINNKRIDNGLDVIYMTYNVRGWLKYLKSNHFRMRLYYTDGSRPLYNGNISGQQWWSVTDNQWRRYDYYYDDLNRIYYARYRNLTRGINYSYNAKMTYDKQGNLQYLARSGQFESQTRNVLIDKLVYKYDGTNPNRLRGVKDYTNNDAGFKDDAKHGFDDYRYDADGNMITDANKNITDIGYNHMNLPVIIKSKQGFLRFTYDALGNKWYKYVEDKTGKRTTAYLFGYQYKFNYISGASNNWKLMFLPTAEGYVSAVYPNDNTGGNPPKYAYVSSLRDHLGNLRLSITRENNRPTILQERHYYPFGMLHAGYGKPARELYYDTKNRKIYSRQTAAGRYKYWYQEQERQTDLDLNWDSFKYRNYDYAIGRFMSVDPLAEKYPYNSTYAFQENKLGLGRELEGLELLYFRYLQFKTNKYIYEINRRNNQISVQRYLNTYGPSPAVKNVSLNLGQRVHQEHVTAYSISILTDNLINSKNKSALITSGYRPPRDQARVMYNNILRKGVANQKRLYGRYGDKIIDTYVAAKQYNKMTPLLSTYFGVSFSKFSRGGIIKLMTKKIEQVGPGKVSKHSSNPLIYNVLDISPGSLQHLNEFINSLKSDLRIKKIITPPKDPAIHIEIPQNN